MKKENGITLISLVITIILILILASVSIYTGVNIYEQMRVKNFVAKMKAVQTAVDKVCDKYTVQEINSKIGVLASTSGDDINILNNVIAEGQAGTLKCWYKEAGDENSNNYIYLTKERINSDLGLRDFDTAIFFNPGTRNIIAVKGVKHENKIYYRQYDLPNGQELKVPNTDTNFTLDVSVKTFDNKAVIYVSTDKNITELKYYKKKDDGTFRDPIIAKNVKEIPITESGIYKVEAKINGSSQNVDNGVVIETADNINVTIVNKPMLVSGMTPIKYDASGSQITTTADDKDWYNYANKKWANIKLKDGSVYVWIPRYAYSITYDNPASNPTEEQIAEGGTINIEFMKDTSDFISTTGNTLSAGYKVMPAFKDGTRNGFANGEWDSELTGIWVAKYETTTNKITVDGEEKDFPKNQFVNYQSWREITPKDAFDICRKMEALTTTTYFDDIVVRASGDYNYGIYQTDINNIDTHLMKNSEYGAVAYLAYSIYGNNTIQPVSTYFANNTGTDNNTSTTGNIYGIYGISGGTKELVAAGRNIEPTDGANLNSENKSTRYTTYYSAQDSNNIYGDAIKETSGWNDCNTEYSSFIFSRGGDKNNLGSGLFAYNNMNAGTDDKVSFRPVLIIEY